MKPTSLYVTTTADNVLRVEADLAFRAPAPTPLVTFRLYAKDGMSEFSLTQIEFAKLCALRETFESDGAAMAASMNERVAARS